MALLALTKYRGTTFVYSTWNPLDAAANILLMTGNTVATTTVTNSSGSVRSTNFITGKRFWQITFQFLSTGEVIAAGIADATALLSDYVGQQATSVALWPSTNHIYQNNVIILATGAGVANNSTIDFAYDSATRNLWISDLSGAWYGGGDPALGTSPAATIGGTGNVFAGCTPFADITTNQVTLRSNPASMSRSPPAGYTAGI